MILAPKPKKEAKPGGAKRKHTNAAKRLAVSMDTLRLQRGMTKKDFAKTIGCCTPYLYEVLSCSGNPTIDTIAGWAAKLGLECFVCFVDRKPEDSSPYSEQLRTMAEASFILTGSSATSKPV